MTEHVRRAGTAGLAGGGAITWTISTGRRGRRWREVRVAPEGGIVLSLLLETDPDRRFSHLELSTAAGLVTLHPENAGTLHGNVVPTDGDGVRHIVGLPWGVDDGVLVEGSACAAAAIAWSLADRLGVGDTTDLGAVRITLDPWVERVSLRVSHPADRSWRIAADGSAVDIDLDADGTPALQTGRSWPLELDRNP